MVTLTYRWDGRTTVEGSPVYKATAEPGNKNLTGDSCFTKFQIENIGFIPVVVNRPVVNGGFVLGGIVIRMVVGMLKIRKKHGVRTIIT